MQQRGFSMVTYSSGDLAGQHFVMLELARRAAAKKEDELDDIETNRISLLCESVSISTTKTAFPMDIPFSGIVSGESATMVMDLGSARKDITLTGKIHDQTISKFSGDGEPKRVNMTSYEIAQLLHSYVDSSFVHEDQNLNKLIILMPSRVDDNFEYRSGVNENTPIEDLPLIPFHFANRSYDVPSWSWGHTEKTFDAFTDTSKNIPGIRGMVSTFSCDFSGPETPLIGFNLTFIQSSVAVSDFINTSF